MSSTTITTAVNAADVPTSAAATPSTQALAISIGRLLPLITLAGLAALAWTGSRLLGYQFNGSANSMIAATVLMTVSIAYGCTARSPALSNMAYFGTVWIIFTNVGAISTYLAAGMHYPLLDGTFTRIDQALGFDWIGWFNFSSRHPWLDRMLSAAYRSLGPQIVISILFLCAVGMQRRCYELWWAALLSLAATSMLSGVLPAVGTFEFYHVAIDRADHLQHFHQLRDGASRVYLMGGMKGIVTFPSFHVVMALLLTHAFRGTRLMLPVAALNFMMLLSTPVYGGHYLVDMLSGAAIAVLAAALVRAAPLLTGARPGWTYDYSARFARRRALTAES